MGLWSALKRACTPHPDDYALSGAEMIDPQQSPAMEAARLSTQEDDMTDYDLEKINAERHRKGLPPLTRSQADTAVASRSSDDGFDMMHFLISYNTGFPMPSSAGIMGAMMHPSSSPPQRSKDWSSGGGSSGGGGASSSYSAPDPSPSYSSSDPSSSSSSSYDSGSNSSSSSSGDGT